jgi:hypothetical protein
VLAAVRTSLLLDESVVKAPFLALQLAPARRAFGAMLLHYYCAM